MAAYFLDTSAAVKLYARERSSDWLLALAVEDHEFIVARITQVEMAAASLSNLILPTADQELVRAAREERLSVENPDDYS